MQKTRTFVNATHLGLMDSQFLFKANDASACYSLCFRRVSLCGKLSHSLSVLHGHLGVQVHSSWACSV